MNEKNKWKLEFYKDMDLTRMYLRCALEYLKYGDVEKVKVKLENILSHLSAFLSSYDEFIAEEREKHLD